MKLHRSIGVIVWLGYGVFSFAGPPEPTRDSPHEWECTYAFSDTTCREMISAWAEDMNLNSTSLADFKQCSDCQRREVVGSYSKRYLIGYECNHRSGYDRRFASLDELVGVYRQAERDDEGWRVNGWGFHRCLLSWRCAESCAIDFDRAICIPLSGYYIGRWIPEMGLQCDSEVTDSEGSDLPLNDDLGRGRQTRWHGVGDLPINDR